jgi:hypothetical protein
MFLSPRGAVAGIELINSVGNLGGVIGPISVGWLTDTMRSFAGGSYFVAGVTAMAAILVMATGPRHVAARQATARVPYTAPTSREVAARGDAVEGASTNPNALLHPHLRRFAPRPLPRSGRGERPGSGGYHRSNTTISPIAGNAANVQIA